MSIDSAFVRRQRIFELISRADTSINVAKLLIPDNNPLLYEKDLWDYKSSFPEILGEVSGESKQKYRLAMAEIEKDAVSFYNSYGGYLLAGVDDRSREVIGFSGRFDCDQLSRRLKAVTGHQIDCLYHSLEYNNGVKLGLLYVPRRRDGSKPAQFIKKAPSSETGRCAYKNGDIYMRRGDECRPAKLAEDYQFLCSSSKRKFLPATTVEKSSLLGNNLPPRDPGLIRFVGREDYLDDLWEWFADPYSRLKLLSGLGGVGKTTLAREFAESIVQSNPTPIEYVVWLSAKPRVFSVLKNKYVEASRIDFVDTESLLIGILEELSHQPGSIEPEMSQQELEHEVAVALKTIPSLVVVDDVDSLPATEQSKLFHAMLRCLSLASAKRTGSSSKCILTARLELGAERSQLMKVEGLVLNEFREYVQILCEQYGVQDSKIDASIKAFHKASGGSPTFAASIFRLVRCGEQFQNAVREWQRADGDEVRRFAFERELDCLTDPQLQIIYALCMLNRSSALELQQVLNVRSKTRFRDNIGRLRDFHLLEDGQREISGGTSLELPPSIRLMKDVVKKKIHNFRRIENDCIRLRKQSTGNRNNQEVSQIIFRVIALWKDEDVEAALDQVRIGCARYKNDGNLRCLLGRAYLRIDPPDAATADIELRRAAELGCSRPELFGLRTEAKKILEDWNGLLAICEDEIKRRPGADSAYDAGLAYMALGKLAEDSGDLISASGRYKDGAMLIQRAFDANYARGRVHDLKELKSSMLDRYVWIVDTTTSKQGDDLDVWLAVHFAFGCHYRIDSVLRLGAQRLVSWWKDVESRDSLSFKTLDLGQVQLGKLDNVVRWLEDKDWRDDSLLDELLRSRKWFDDHLDSYAATLNEPHA